MTWCCHGEYLRHGRALVLQFGVDQLQGGHMYRDDAERPSVTPVVAQHLPRTSHKLPRHSPKQHGVHFLMFQLRRVASSPGTFSRSLVPWYLIRGLLSLQCQLER